MSVFYVGVLWLITHPEHQAIAWEVVHARVARARRWWETVQAFREISDLPETRNHREHSS